MGVFFHLRCHQNDMVHSNDNVAEGAMPSEERMTIDERYKYLRIKQKRYVGASRKERSRMLADQSPMIARGDL